MAGRSLIMCINDIKDYQGHVEMAGAIFSILATLSLILRFLRWLFIVFFVQSCIHDYGYSVCRRTRIFGSMEGPLAENTNFGSQ